MSNPFDSHLTQTWREIDPQTFELGLLEEERQRSKIILIAALSICPPAVRQAMSSSFCNIDAEGFPPLRMSRDDEDNLVDFQRQLAYYRRFADSRSNKCTEYANIVEVLAQRRLAKLFASNGTNIPADRIFVNLQPASGAIANAVIFDALLEPGDKILSMALGHGGHLSHGSEFHFSSDRYDISTYGINLDTGKLDYDALEELAVKVEPRLLIAGSSSYPWHIDWARLRLIVDKLPRSAYLMADIAHPAGLIVAGLYPNPLGYADVSTLVTYKTLCGPRGAAILTTDERLSHKIDRALFPRLQSAPIFSNVAGMAVAFQIAQTADFKGLQQRIVNNAKALAAGLEKRGLKLAYGGTNSHLVILDLSSLESVSGLRLKGEPAARVLDLCNVVCNKNVIPGDITAANASGLRFGTTWVSQLGMTPNTMDKVAEIVHMVVTNIEPFFYSGFATDHRTGRNISREIPQGKIKFQVLEEAKAMASQVLQMAE